MVGGKKDSESIEANDFPLICQDISHISTFSQLGMFFIAVACERCNGEKVYRLLMQTPSI